MLTPYPHQQKRAAFLAANKRAGDFSEPGVGKTGAAIIAAQQVDAQRILVICPAISRTNWRREFEAFNNIPLSIQILRTGKDKLIDDILITSYNLITSSKLITKQIMESSFDVIILDESHALKNPKSARTRTILGKRCDGSGIVSRGRYVWCLSGTPSPNHPAEMYSLINSCWPDRFPDLAPGYLGFVDRYAKRKDTRYGMHVFGGRNMDELNQRMEGTYCKDFKADVVKSLPPKQYSTVTVDPLKTSVELLKLEKSDEMAELRKVIEEAKAKKSGQFVVRESELSTLRRLTGMAKAPAAAQYIADVLDGGVQKLLVFRHHNEVGDLLQRQLGRFPLVEIYGGQLPDKRQEAIDDFQNDPSIRVCIASLGAANSAITLHAASDAIFVESDWSPSVNVQAANRIHRIGQTEHVWIRFLALAGSLDDDIQRILQRKTWVLDQLLQGETTNAA